MPTEYKPIYIKHYYLPTFNPTHLPFAIQQRVLSQILTKVTSATSNFITRHKTLSPTSFTWLSTTALKINPTDISAWWSLLQRVFHHTSLPGSQILFPSKLANAFTALECAQDALEYEAPEIPLRSLLMIVDDAWIVTSELGALDVVEQLGTLRSLLRAMVEIGKLRGEQDVSMRGENRVDERSLEMLEDWVRLEDGWGKGEEKEREEKSDAETVRGSSETLVESIETDMEM